MGGSPAEAKVFNPNIEKLYPKTVSCHLFGYIEKSKGFRFYCPKRHTNFVETRHAVFLEKEKMRGSMVAREIDLEVKRVCRRNMVGSLPRVMPKVVDYRQTDAQATNKMVTQDRHEVLSRFGRREGVIPTSCV